jgi:hypothetical protein
MSSANASGVSIAIYSLQIKSELLLFNGLGHSVTLQDTGGDKYFLAHNLKVRGSNPLLATTFSGQIARQSR